MSGDDWIGGPVRQFFDWVAIGGRPSDADYTKLVGQCVDDETGMTAEQLRRELRSTARDIAAAHKRGMDGEARNIGRESAIVISSALGELPPPPSRDAGRPMRDIIADVPR